MEVLIKYLSNINQRTVVLVVLYWIPRVQGGMRAGELGLGRGRHYFTLIVCMPAVVNRHMQ